MNVERLYAALNYLMSVKNGKKIITRIDALVTSLKQSIDEPSDQTNEAFKKNYAELSETLASCESNNVGPTVRMIFNEIGAEDKLGVGLLSRIKSTISDNNVTPSSALSGINVIRDNVDGFYLNVKSMLSGFNDFGFEYDVLEVGEYEIGVSIPRSNIGGDLASIIKEFKIIDQSFRPFNELVGADVVSCNLKAISSSEWQIFLDSGPVVSVAIITALERAVALYKNILESMKLHKELINKDYPENIVSDSKKHIDDKLQKDIREVAEDIVNEEYKENNEDRRNELVSDISFSLRFLVKRIDAGVTIEIKTEPPEEPVKPKKPVKPDGLEQQAQESQDEYAKSISSYKEKYKEYERNVERYKIQLTISNKIYSCNESIIRLKNESEGTLQISLNDEEKEMIREDVDE